LNGIKIKVVLKDHAFEVRFDDLLIVSPSIHGDGNPWTVLGTSEIAFLSDQEMSALEAKIDDFSMGYMPENDKEAYIKWLEDPNTIIYEGQGHGRHNAVRTVGCSYYFRYKDGWIDFSDDQRREKLQQWNEQHCRPPLPEKEFDGIWKWIVNTKRKTRDQEHEEHRRTSSSSVDGGGIPDMPGCISYQISQIAAIWITGTPDNKLVEILRKSKEDVKNGTVSYYFVTKKTFTACKPVKIIKHKSPLSFLQALF
jgi:hypothetical protein